MTLSRFLERWPPKEKKVILCFSPSYKTKKMSIEKAVKKYGDAEYSYCYHYPFFTIVISGRR